MKYRLAALFLLLCAFMPPSKPFPQMQVKSLEGKSMNLPADAKGKFALIGIAYSLKAQDDLYSWYEPVMGSLAENPMIPVNVYFIPMTGDIKGMSQDKIEEKIKSSLDRSIHKNVLLYQEDPSPFIQSLNMKDKNLPYIFLVDPRGDIVYNTSGKYSEQKMDVITDKLAE